MCFDSGTVLLTVRASDCSLKSLWCGAYWLPSGCWPCCSGGEAEAVAMKLEVDLPKQQKLQGGCLHILGCKANDTKQCA